MVMMICRPTQSERDALVKSLREVLDPDLLGLPKGVVRKVETKSAQKLSLRPAADLGGLAGLMQMFAVRGPLQSAREAAELMMQIDPTGWDLDRNYIVGPLNIVDYFSARQIPALPLLERPDILLWRPPNPRRFNVRRVFEDNPYAGYPMDMTSTIVGDAFHDLDLFARLWIEGGYEDWSVDRIHRQVDATLAGLAALPAFGPFERPEPVR